MVFNDLYRCFMDISKNTKLIVVFLLYGKEKYMLHLTAGKTKILYGKYEVSYFYKYDGLEDVDFVIALRLDYDN